MICFSFDSFTTYTALLIKTTSNNITSKKKKTYETLKFQHLPNN